MAQTPLERYNAAETIFKKHVKEYDFLHDDSPGAIAALTAMHAAAEDAAIDQLIRNPTASADDLDVALCEVQSSLPDCSKTDGHQTDAIRLGPQLFAVSIFSGESGIVFIVGPRNGKPSLLWSIDAAGSQSLDPRGLLPAWQADRAGGACREDNSGHLPGTCGPLYASLGLLPSDAEGRPRFYVNAGYAQTMGATIGNQSSVWRWDGDHATLLWINWHDTMIDQRHSVDFKDGILGFWEKEDWRTFFSCGGCEGRQVIQRLRITPTSVDYLGKAKTQPELDLIDELFWRLAHGRPTSDIASPQVSNLLRPQVIAETKESKKIDKYFLSVGMFGDSSSAPIAGGEKFCFTADDIGRLEFIIQSTPSCRKRLTHVSQPSGNYDSCVPREQTNGLQ